MSRNIVVCCDGTSNQPSKAPTNVAKLVYTLVKDPAHQLVYYHPGLGTMAAPGYTTKIGSRGARLAGLAFGHGLKDDLRDAYTYIMEHWRPGDRIFLFGFSRGAYTVRALASLIQMYGMAMQGNAPLVPYAVDMMWKANQGDGHFTEAMALAGQFKTGLTTGECPIHFMGVWDTVSSVGWVGSPVSFPHTRSNDAIANIRHAVSIDERRAFFRTNLFGRAADQDLLEVWFPGEHCDVGGGHPEAESGLSKYPLSWMIAEAAAKGLLVDDLRVKTVLGEIEGNYAKASPDAKLHDSMTGAWRLTEFAPKRRWSPKNQRYRLGLNLFRRRGMGKAPVVHDVAWQILGYSARLPEEAIRLSDHHGSS
jgi:uncharacterized protein (DUF2235 family)